MLVTSYQVRSFQLSDSVAVTELFRNVMSDDCYDETMAAFARQLSWDSELILVAEEEQKIVGVIVGTIDKQQAYYYRIASGKSISAAASGKR